MRERILTTANIILTREVINGTQCLRNGRITSIEAAWVPLPGVIDCEGDYISPGFIELHAGDIERRLAPRPNSFIEIIKTHRVRQHSDKICG